MLGCCCLASLHFLCGPVVLYKIVNNRDGTDSGCCSAKKEKGGGGGDASPNLDDGNGGGMTLRGGLGCMEIMR